MSGAGATRPAGAGATLAARVAGTPQRVLRRLGPGLITGAADDDPSGIATYSQAGAAFGYTMGWSVVLSLPFMIAVQEISARLGRVTGTGLAATLRRHAPAPVLHGIVALLLVANIINLGADIGAMAEAMRLVLGAGPVPLYAIGVALFCVACEIWLAYRRYVTLLKWLTLSLFAYVALLFVVKVPWAEAMRGILLPRVPPTREGLSMLVAVLGTTISPYLFFWQASEEAEDALNSADPRPLREHAEDAPGELARIRIDTWVGMAFSNMVALAIIIGTAATLHAAGIREVTSAQEAATALAPIAGPFAGAVFAAGIFGTGLLAVPTLAGSAAYGLGEALQWTVGLSRRAVEARAFYGTIAGATLLGTLMVFSSIDAMQALFWAAILNGAAAAPMIIAMVMLGSSSRVMGTLTLSPALRMLGWITAILMGASTVGMLLL